MAIYADCKSKREARLRWRKSPKGKAWDKAYYQRPYVQAKRKAKKLMRISKALLLNRQNEIIEEKYQKTIENPLYVKDIPDYDEG